MIDVTEAVQQVREASRLTWNLFLFPGEDRYVETREEAIDRIELALFQAIVFDGRDLSPKRVLRVRLRRSTAVIKRPELIAHGNRRWHDSVTQSASLGEMRFVRFWDWHSFARRDYAFVECSEDGCESTLLLSHHDCGFYLAEDGP